MKFMKMNEFELQIWRQCQVMHLIHKCIFILKYPLNVAHSNPNPKLPRTDTHRVICRRAHNGLCLGDLESLTFDLEIKCRSSRSSR